MMAGTDNAATRGQGMSTGDGAQQPAGKDAPARDDADSAFQPTLLMTDRNGRKGGSNAAAAPAEPRTLPGAAGTTADGVVNTVGRYRVGQRIGRGGMASVFRAHDPSIGRDVALKFLHASLCEDAECRSRFLREARAAGGLSHPNIVVVHDVGEIEGRPYMAMEMMSGSTLSEELAQSRQLPVREAVTVTLQLAKALDYAHKKGVVHRDIKPGNIMRDAASRAVKLTDFGIAHVEDGGSGEQRTRVGDVIGTPQYMSPEQARGEKLDGRSDLFSVGIVLYQCLTGTRPFRGDSLVAIATKIANEEHPPIDKARKDIPASLRRVIDRCLAKAAAQRFQSGRELAEALARVRSELDENARDAARPRIVPLRVKWAATMALIVAVVMGLTATVITQKQHAALMAQVVDSGASLARFVATQAAAPALGEEWEALDVQVQELMKTGNFERLVLVDLAGVVRASSVAGQAGQRYAALPGQALASPGRNVNASRYEAAGEPVLGFETPITFQDKRVGQVFLGIAERPLAQVANLSITLMAVLAVVTVLAVALAMFVLAQWFAKPVRVLGEAMGEITKGRLHHRIAEKRNDEFGLLYADFDAMAQALQERGAQGQGETPSPTRGQPATPGAHDKA
jgi:eukaryotic-like serine/threonine-protein kinase